MLDVIAHYLTAAYYAVAAPRVVKEVVHSIEYKHSPHGLAWRDVAHLEKYIGAVQYTMNKTTLEEIAYRQGQVDAIELLKKHIGGRV